MLNYRNCLTVLGMWLAVKTLVKDYMNCKAASERMNNDKLHVVKTKVTSDVLLHRTLYKAPK